MSWRALASIHSNFHRIKAYSYAGNEACKSSGGAPSAHPV
jgi:hypothetical protein